MSHWSDTAYKALGVAQEACRSRSLDEAIRAADNATNLLLEARNARDILFNKRDKAWETLAATHNLTLAERSLMRAGFYSAWELATGAGEEKDIPIQGSDAEDVPPGAPKPAGYRLAPGYTHKIDVAVRVFPIYGSEHNCRTWMSDLVGRRIWTETDHTHQGRQVGVIDKASMSKIP